MKPKRDLGDPAAVWIPPWVPTLGLPVWISGPDRRISFVNERAIQFLALPPAQIIGRRCFELIRARDSDGESFCGPACPVYLRALQKQEIEPVQLRLPASSPPNRWVRLLTICVTGEDGSGPWLVHCVLNEQKAHRVEEYFERVASRSRGPAAETPIPSGSVLTAREREILAHLARDETIQEIAASLHVSYATVRNHIQHLQAKLGVHSIMEAVAFALLAEE